MRKVKRRLRKHFGATAHRVTVRSQKPWYWLPLVIAAATVLGYGAAYIQLVGVKLTGLNQDVTGLRQQNELLQVKLVQTERLLQIEKAAQSNLGRDLVSLQDESMRLREDIAFYRNILTDRSGQPEVKIHAFKISKDASGNLYDYHILLMQSGSHDRPVQGQLKLNLMTSDGRLVPIALGQDATGKASIVNFKYYQQLDGKIQLPQEPNGYLELAFVEKGTDKPKAVQRISLSVDSSHA